MSPWTRAAAIGLLGLVAAFTLGAQVAPGTPPS